MADVLIVIEGVREVAEALGHLPAKIDRNTARALNKTATSARTQFARRVRQEVAFPASYLGPSGGRLTVGEKASPSKLSIRIDGRDRPTSLARFVKGRGKEPKVRVKPSRAARRIPRTFVINLRSGNVGLAMRHEGKPSNAYKPKEIGKNLWLLYGPSVDQVLQGVGARDGGVFGEEEQWAVDFFQREFERLMGVEGLD